MSKDTKIEMRTQKDWITFKTKFKGMAIRKGFKPALASPRPSGEALMVPDPSDATGRTLVPETPNQIATRLADWNTANSLCWAYHHPNGKASRKKRSRDDCNDSRDEDAEREELAQLKKKLKNQEEQHEAHLAHVASLLVTKGIKPGDVGCGGYWSE